LGRVDGKVAVVTGGARGIGAAAVARLAREGASVAITDVIEDEGRELAAALQEEGLAVDFWPLDVTDEAVVARVFGEVQERFGTMGVLVNNAGIAGANKPTHELTVEEWQQVQDVNVKGVFLCTKHAVPAMQANGGGSIINLSSIYGLVGAPDIPPYHASKGSVRLSTKTDALLYAEDGIRVNSVHPGYIWTPLVADLGKRLGKTEEEFQQELGSRHPIGHVGEPDDIANGILFLASEESKFMTGSELVIDGGYTAR